MAVKPLRLGLLIEPEIIPTPQATTWRYSSAPDLANQAVIPCDVVPRHYIEQPMGVTQGLEVTRMPCYRWPMALSCYADIEERQVGLRNGEC